MMCVSNWRNPVLVFFCVFLLQVRCEVNGERSCETPDMCSEMNGKVLNGSNTGGHNGTHHGDTGGKKDDDRQVEYEACPARQVNINCTTRIYI